MILSASSVRLSYGSTPALRDASVTVRGGEAVALTGASGSGKTSLLYCLSGLVSPDDGVVEIDGMDIGSASTQVRARIRRERFGFVFQGAELVPELTLAENIGLPLELLGVARRRVAVRVRELMESLGIAELLRRRPNEVSGGQAQRAAVARALVHEPDVLFADEPTGALDSSNGAVVLDALLELARRTGSAVVLVTHDAGVARRADRQVIVKDGCCDDFAAAAS